MDTMQTDFGEYSILHAPGGRLAPDALERFRTAVTCGSELLYANHTVLFSGGHSKLVDKPDWSPDTLLSVNYIESPIAVPSRLLPQGSMDAFASPTGRYALTLLLTERAQSILRIRAPLFTSLAERPCTDISPVRHALRRRGARASVEEGEIPGSFAVRYAVNVDMRVSCIIYGNGRVRHVRHTLESIVAKCCWPRIELLVADNGEIEAEKERYYAALAQNHAVRIVRVPDVASLARAVNIAASRSSGEALLFLPAGARLDAHDAIERMLELACQTHIGAVGGVRTGAKGGACGIIHNVKSMDGALMTMRDRFFASGCFDETFTQAGFVRAYTLLTHAGRQHNVVTPYTRFQYETEADMAAISEQNRLRIQDMQRF